MNENAQGNEDDNVFISNTSLLYNNLETLEHKQDDENIDFHDLYMQFVSDTEEEKIESKFHDMQFLKDFQSSQAITMRTIETQTSETQINQDSDERFLWEKYSTSVVSKIMEKMGYKGKGLGKAENGFVEPISGKKDLFKSMSEKK